MLHELLFVLMGYSGDVFIPYPPHPNTASTYSIPPNFPLLHPTERDCLNRFGQIGWIYSQINGFITCVRELRSTTNIVIKRDRPHGAYVLALVTSIESTLNEYRQDILDMETRILNKEDEAGSKIVPLSLLTANLSRWELLLPALWKIIQVLQNDPKKYHGCNLFDLLMDQARTGVLESRCEIEKMMVQLHNVLYRQLTAWMVYGQWADPDNEFFIVPYKADNNPLAARTGWNRLYVIDYNKVPSHLSHSLVESILFVGKAIATVNEMDNLSASISKHDDDPLSESSKPMRLMAQSHKRISIPEEMRKKHLQLLLSLHSFNKQNSSNSPSPWIRYPQELKSIVGEVRKSTADWLFSQVLVGDHGLHRYLNSFRHLFLLNYGDLAANFIQECTLWRRRSLLRSSSATATANHVNNRNRSNSNKSNNSSNSPNGGDNVGRVSPSVNRNPSKTALIFRHQELNALLGKSSIGTDAEGQLNGFSLLLDDEQTKEYPFSDLLLVDVRVLLTYDLEWPIDLFLGESDLKNYSNLWSFLISLKNTQMMLNNLWKTLRTGNSSSLPEDNSPATQRRHFSSIKKAAILVEENDGYQERLVWRLRSLMLFWIDTLWNHIQVCSYFTAILTFDLVTYSVYRHMLLTTITSN
jgi:gamma-tubulin complex component 4